MFKFAKKIRPESPNEKLSRYLWSIIFAPDYSATGLAAKMWTNALCILDFYDITVPFAFLVLPAICHYINEEKECTFIKYNGESIEGSTERANKFYFQILKMVKPFQCRIKQYLKWWIKFSLQF